MLLFLPSSAFFPTFPPLCCLLLFFLIMLVSHGFSVAPLFIASPLTLSFLQFSPFSCLCAGMVPGQLAAYYSRQCPVSISPFNLHLPFSLTLAPCPSPYCFSFFTTFHFISHLIVFLCVPFAYFSVQPWLHCNASQLQSCCSSELANVQESGKNTYLLTHHVPL